MDNDGNIYVEPDKNFNENIDELQFFEDEKESKKRKFQNKWLEVYP